MRMMRRFSTLADAIEQAVKPAIGTEYVDAEAFDLQAIAEGTYAYRVDRDAEGNELLGTAGFEQAVSGEQFWELVEKHEKSATS